ncbi:pentatricopeptide repeat-containing protein [Pyrus ussuriensis x Pyrus communis]|uniref:Pentatricopeptide repeat-containing protein n=1 Tax=Pyrus ussuriensis x Pyrus communis TaxID=2448454 RepID=A0A5N5GK72_9ROSA|nr:pentatricopeptide repeat-containing protein [Pyrus ussuriensis x Pyrus communis]
MRAFNEVYHVLVEMHKREGLISEGTYEILQEKEFGLELDLVAFQKLILWLCRHKHVEAVEALFNVKGKEFGQDIKTWNIFLMDGVCERSEAKRFWKGKESWVRHSSYFEQCGIRVATQTW